MDNGLDIDERRIVLAFFAAAPDNAKTIARFARAFVASRTRGDAAAATARTLDALGRRLGAMPDWGAADRSLAWASRKDHAIITLFDPGYPPALAAIANPPVVLFVGGDDALLARPQLAIVGSRKASHYGIECARRLAATLAADGIVVTSGMAAGVDAAAHRGALDVHGGTVAVYGCGIDRVYPHHHRDLAAAITASGAVVSEFPLGAAPRPYHFPRRNRIISGLSRATIIVEAAANSGSMTTARHALDQGRDVFAVPGSVNNPNAAGCHQLLKDGAGLVEHAGDILPLFDDVLAARATHTARENPARENTAGVAANEQRLLEACAFDAASFDDIVRRSGLTPPEVSSILSALEVRGLVRSLAGNTYLKTGA